MEKSQGGPKPIISQSIFLEFLLGYIFYPCWTIRVPGHGPLIDYRVGWNNYILLYFLIVALFQYDLTQSSWLRNVAMPAGCLCLYFWRSTFQFISSLNFHWSINVQIVAEWGAGGGRYGVFWWPCFQWNASQVISNRKYLQKVSKSIKKRKPNWTT